MLQQVALRAAADDVLRGGKFVQGIVVGAFEATTEVEYCHPDGLH